jgi:hypothetical protein
MSDRPELPTVVLARFKTLPPRGGRSVELPVHFNPASLQYTIANTLKEEGSGSKKKQFVDKTTAKLTMQLVFDTTHNGEDVRAYTDKIAGMLKPIPEGSKQVPPNVEFTWGLYRFCGMVETYKETIDFFAASGVPLRANVDITLASQAPQFTSGRNPNATVDEPPSPEPAVLPPGPPGPSGPSPSSVANSVGDPRSARAIAAANGSASLRFGGGVGLAVGASVELKAEAGFSAGAGLGFGGGAGVGLGGAAGGGIGGANSTGGAFAGLRTSVAAPTSMPSASAVLAGSAKVGAVGASAQFGFGGQAQMEPGASLGADVGADADLNALLRFG